MLWQETNRKGYILVICGFPPMDDFQEKAICSQHSKALQFSQSQPGPSSLRNPRTLGKKLNMKSVEGFSLHFLYLLSSFKLSPTVTTSVSEGFHCLAADQFGFQVMVFWCFLTSPAKQIFLRSFFSVTNLPQDKDKQQINNITSTSIIITSTKNHWCEIKLNVLLKKY